MTRAGALTDQRGLIDFPNLGTAEPQPLITHPTQPLLCNHTQRHKDTWSQDFYAKTCSNKPNMGGGDDSHYKKNSWTETCHFSILPGCVIPWGLLDIM